MFHLVCFMIMLQDFSKKKKTPQTISRTVTPLPCYTDANKFRRKSTQRRLFRLLVTTLFIFQLYFLKLSFVSKGKKVLRFSPYSRRPSHKSLRKQHRPRKTQAGEVGKTSTFVKILFTSLFLFSSSSCFLLLVERN